MFAPGTNVEQRPDFWIANSGRERNLSMSECVDGFRGIWDYCHYGGRTYHEAWYFR
jgi:hypothetical protein